MPPRTPEVDSDDEEYLNCWPGWSSVVWGACARYWGVPLHPQNTQASNSIPATQSSEHARIPTPATQSSADASNSTPQPEQVQMAPQYELMELDMPDLIEVITSILILINTSHYNYVYINIHFV